MRDSPFRHSHPGRGQGLQFRPAPRGVLSYLVKSHRVSHCDAEVIVEKGKEGPGASAR